MLEKKIVHVDSWVRWRARLYQTYGIVYKCSRVNASRVAANVKTIVPHPLVVLLYICIHRYKIEKFQEPKVSIFVRIYLVKKRYQ